MVNRARKWRITLLGKRVLVLAYKWRIRYPSLQPAILPTGPYRFFNDILPDNLDIEPRVLDPHHELSIF